MHYHTANKFLREFTSLRDRVEELERDARIYEDEVLVQDIERIKKSILRAKHTLLTTKHEGQKGL